MQMAALFREYQRPFEAKYADRILPGQRAAIAAIIRCRTPEAGTIHSHCNACGNNEWHACSCGHRSCPQCQNHEATCWLARQREKLLPVDYFLATFMHMVVPGGGVDVKQHLWKPGKKKYLFNAFALARVFRGKLLHEIAGAGLQVPADMPKKWVVDCRHTGRGESALAYLSRYLYRGVVSESSIVANQDGKVTFRYTDGKSKETRTETLPGEDFSIRVAQPPIQCWPGSCNK